MKNVKVMHAWLVIQLIISAIWITLRPDLPAGTSLLTEETFDLVYFISTLVFAVSTLTGTYLSLNGKFHNYIIPRKKPLTL